MSENSFEKQYPGYDLIPEKKSKWTWPLIWAGAAVLVLGIPGLVFYKLSTYQVPTPLMVGVDKFTLSTAAQLASNQSAQGNHKEAAQSFERYFALGGQDADVMAMYAYSLLELGRKAEALTWSRKALQKEPTSKAAHIIHDALEPK